MGICDGMQFTATLTFIHCCLVENKPKVYSEPSSRCSLLVCVRRLCIYAGLSEPLLHAHGRIPKSNVHLGANEPSMGQLKLNN